MESKLKLKELVDIQHEMNLYLQEIPGKRSLPNQQFSVRDGNDKEIVSIVAKGYYFTAEELRKQLAEIKEKHNV